ncbi:MAG: diguanylate cyclase [bacterium]
MDKKYDPLSVIEDFEGPCRERLNTLATPAEHPGPTTSWRELIRALADVDLTEEQAQGYGRSIIDHREIMERTLGRPVDLRLALLDFFTTVQPLLTCPKIVDMERYLDTLRYGNADPLTGLANRRHIDDQLHREVNRSRRYGLEFSILYADIDNFKKINDNFGHATGDAVLRAFADHLRERLRGEDVAGRYGGEEFVVLMPRTSMDGAHCLARRLAEGFAAREIHADRRVTFSGGIATYPRHGAEVAALLAHADKGLYRAKMMGKNQIIVEPPEKRRHERVPASRPVTYVAEESSFGFGTTRDVSLSGLRISTDQTPREGQYISISVDTPSRRAEYLVGAQIVWVRRREDEPQVEFGARYAEKDPQTVERLFTEITAGV